MSIRRTFVAILVGIGLPLTAMAAPATAATSTPTPTPQCQGLLTCVVPIVTGLTGAVVGTTTGVVSTVPTIVGNVPKIVGTVPTVLSTLLGGNPATSPGQGTTPPPTKPPHHVTPPPTTTHHTTTSTIPRRTTTTVKVTSPVTIPSVIDHNPGPQAVSNSGLSIGDILGDLLGGNLVSAASKIVTLFGWNLLALIPMGGIAFVISRRMASGRRSASGLV